MKKVVAAVIRSENKVLLMRRAPGHNYAGQWEYPGGKVEEGEGIATALHRELKEELNINANIGRMITSVVSGPYEIYAYDIISYTGDIQLLAHDAMEWVDLDKLVEHKQLPADKQISMKITKTRSHQPQDIDLKARIFAFNQVIIPFQIADNGTVEANSWVVSYKVNGQEQKKLLPNRDEAFLFYIKKVNEIIADFKARQIQK